MSSQTRVLNALSFRPVDVIPIYDSFWPEWLTRWRRAKGVAAPPDGAPAGDVDPFDAFGAYDRDAYRWYGIDIRIVSAKEGPWPSRVRRLAPDGDYLRHVDAWGSVVRTRRGAYFVHMEDPRLAPHDHSLDALHFEPATLDERYREFLTVVEAERAHCCVFAKVGGPFLRTTRLRGFEQWLIDLAEAPDFAAELAGRVADHLADVGLECLRRAKLYGTGIWIFDDMAHNLGTLFAPRTFEQVFLPAYARMIARFKAAGARFVFLHSDGDIRAILPQLIEAGIEGINPVEYKAGMHVPELRRQYGDRLRLVGGLDNAHLMPAGTEAEFAAHVREMLAVAREGGVVLGAHSIGPDVTVERYDYCHELIRPGYVPPVRTTVRTPEHAIPRGRAIE